MGSLLVTGARRPDGQLVDVRIEDGRIEAVASGGAGRDGSGRPVLDGAGLLMLPTLVDGHCHPDKTTWGGPWVSRQPAETLEQLIDNDVLLQKSLDRSVTERVAELMSRYVARGARGLRAHVDVAPEYGLGNLLGVLEAAAQVSAALHVETVAFPQLGVMRAPGTASLLRDAVEAGADIIGGLDPGGIDGDLHGQLDILFGLAEELDVPLDIHLHDRGEHGREQVREIIRRTHAAGLVGRVTIGHAFCYGDLDAAAVSALADETAQAGITLATCALGGDPVLPVAELRRAGVRVVLGSDGIRDAWSPFGNADMLDRTHLLAYRTGAATDAELEACLEVAAHEGAALLGLERSGLEAGDPADFMLLPATSPAQAVVDRPAPTWVVRGGRVVAHDRAMVPISVRASGPEQETN